MVDVFLYDIILCSLLYFGPAHCVMCYSNLFLGLASSLRSKHFKLSRLQWLYCLSPLVRWIWLHVWPITRSSKVNSGIKGPSHPHIIIMSFPIVDAQQPKTKDVYFILLSTLVSSVSMRLWYFSTLTVLKSLALTNSRMKSFKV